MTGHRAKCPPLIRRRQKSVLQQPQRLIGMIGRRASSLNRTPLPLPRPQLRRVTGKIGRLPGILHLMLLLTVRACLPQQPAKPHRRLQHQANNLRPTHPQSPRPQLQEASGRTGLPVNILLLNIPPSLRQRLLWQRQQILNGMTGLRAKGLQLLPPSIAKPRPNIHLMLAHCLLRER